MAAEGPGPTAPRRPLPAPQPLAPAQVVAGVLGVVLVVAGLIGLAVDTSWHTGSGLQGKHLLGLEVNGWHNLIHVASGLLLLAGVGSRSAARAVCRLFGVAYIVVTIAGIAGGNDAFGLIPINPGDDVLHAVLALVALWAAALSKDKRDVLARDRVVVAAPDDPTHVVGPGSGHVGGPRAIGPRIDRRLPQKTHP
ncbi:MAG: hypothetical protein JWM71_2039 [Solirubrobacteraceae bacterium]|nr:hypothetical protein [Solirubrobacteraceae bacterium]